MDSNNPYAAPASSVAVHANPGTEEANSPASRGSRLLAQIIDALVVAPFTGLFFWYISLPYFAGQSGRAALVVLSHASTVTKFYQQSTLDIAQLIIFFVLNGYLLKNRGQSIGKWLSGIRVVALDGSKAGMPALVARTAAQSLLSVVPGIGSLLVLIDYLFIFSDSRRCLHDRLARTRVVRT